MPFPLAAVIGAGASLLGGLLNSGSQRRQNQRSMNFSREMYAKQYADQVALWRMQNEYNTPNAQMQRFREAGLNPNLIYGQGNSGNAGSVSVPNVQSPDFKSPNWGEGVSNAGLVYMNALYDLDIKAAQADNLRDQNSVIKQEMLLKAAQTGNILTGEEATRFDLDFKRELKDVSADFKRQQLRKLKADIDFTMHEDIRKGVALSSSVNEAFNRVLNMREQRLNYQLDRARNRVEIGRIRSEAARIRESAKLMRQDQVLKDLEINLRQQGINPNDPMWARIVGQILSSLYDRYLR